MQVGSWAEGRKPNNIPLCASSDHPLTLKKKPCSLRRKERVGCSQIRGCVPDEAANGTPAASLLTHRSGPRCEATCNKAFGTSTVVWTPPGAEQIRWTSEHLHCNPNPYFLTFAIRGPQPSSRTLCRRSKPRQHRHDTHDVKTLVALQPALDVVVCQLCYSMITTSQLRSPPPPWAVQLESALDIGKEVWTVWRCV